MPSRSRTRSSARSNSTARARSWPSALLVLALAGGGCATAGPATETVRVDASQAWQLVGFSAEGRQLLATAFGPADAPRLYVVGGIHGDESEGRIALQPLVREWTDAPVRVRVLADANPDGSAANTRTNAHGIDLNRNWPATNFEPGRGRGSLPLSESEAAAVHADMLAFDPDLVVVVHSSRRGPFVNFDGPARGYADAFAESTAALAEPWTVVPNMGYPTPGSLGSWMGRDRGIPILTLEFERGGTIEAAGDALAAGMPAVFEQLAKRHAPAR